MGEGCVGGAGESDLTTITTSNRSADGFVVAPEANVVGVLRDDGIVVPTMIRGSVVAITNVVVAPGVGRVSALGCAVAF
jgi:hypothetical protein